MGNVSMIDGHIDEPRMKDKRAINLLSQMYLPCFDDEEKSALTFAINAIQDNSLQKAENKSLTEKLEAMGDPLEKAQYKMAEQKAEIERLNLENLQMVASIKNLKAEAIKEVTAELYNSFRQYETYDKHSTFEILDRIESVEEFLLNNIKKEMVGDAE